MTLENLGAVYYRTQRYDQTLRLLDQVLAMRKQVLGDDHAAVARTLHNMGAVSKRFGEAEGLLLSAHATRMKTFGENHASTHAAASALVKLYDAWGQPDKAAAWRRP